MLDDRYSHHEKRNRIQEDSIADFIKLLRKSSLSAPSMSRGFIGQKSGLYISAHDDSVRHDSRVGSDVLVGMMVTHDDRFIGEMLNMTLLQV